jgi:PAS domain S-box-containing protein
MPLFPKAQALLGKISPKRTLHWQVAFTLLAFAAMVIISYFIMSATIRGHLARNSEAMLDLAMVKIEAELRGPETTLRAFAETVRQRILQGGAAAYRIRALLPTFESHLSYHSKGGTTPVYLFGIFYTLGPRPVFMHSNNWQPPAGYDPPNRPWHQAAMLGGGLPARSRMYLDISSNQYVFAIAQSILDESGRLLAVVCLQVPFSLLGEIVMDTAKEQGGHGMILGHNLKVLAHPNPDFVGLNVPHPALTFSIFHNNFLKGEDIFERPMTSHAGEASLAFFRKTPDGWYYGAVVPSAPYYESITNLWSFLIALGVAAAAFLIYMLARTDAKKNRATALTCALNKMSEIFLTPSGGAVEDTLSAGGRLLADLADLDRFSLFRNHQADGVLHMSQIYRWDKASGGTTKPDEAYINIAYANTVPTWEHLFQERKTVNGPVNQMPEREEATLTKGGVVTAFAAPIYINGGFWGFALFEDRLKKRVFAEDLAETMRSAAFLFANAVTRAELEARLASERDFTQNLLDAAPIGLNIWDENFNIISCNDAVQNIFGCTKQYYMDNFYEFSPEYQPDGTKSASKAKELLTWGRIGETFVTEWEHRSASGEPIPCEATHTVLTYNNKQVAAVYLYDLRNLKKMEKAVLAAGQMQVLIDAVPLSCTLLDKDANVLTCNKSAVDFFGLAGKEDIQRMFTDLMPEYQPDGGVSKQVAAEALKKAYDEGQVFVADWTHRSLGGELLPCEVTLVRVEYGGDRVIAGYARDLRAFREAREANERAQIMFDTAPFASCLFDKDSKVVDCNQEVVNMFGIPDKEFFQANFFSRLFPKYQPDGAFSAEVSAENGRLGFEKGYHRFECLHQKLNGEPLPREVIMVRVKHRGENVLAGHFRDLTEQKALLQMAKQQAEGEAANRAKSSFLATMSHEMRTPMNTILGVTEIQLQNESLAPETKHALQMIYSSGYSLLAIINDLLDLSKIEAGKVEMMNDRYETASLINDTINISAARLGSKPIEFKLQVDEGLPLELIGDALRIKQILNNLLSNAFKYTDQGEVELSFHAATTGGEGDNNAPTVMLILTVRDTGQGMTPEQVRDLFDAYSRFNQKANRFVEGTGLGMNIVRHLVDNMGGDISVDSAPGQGTKVTVRLPQGYVGPQRLGRKLAENLMSFRLTRTTKTTKAQISREHMPYGRVLVVDDMETNLYVARGFLLPYGLSIDTALSGPEALAKIEAGHVYDIIFMDHMMPVMDGLEVVKAIRGQGYARPIVALTANAVAGQAEMFLANGFDGFISKPIDIREMNVALNRFVRDRQTPETVAAARAAYGGHAAAGGAPPRTDYELGKIFTKDAEKAAAVLETYEARGSYATDDLKMYVINVHALKSALANVGEAELSALARELEKAGRDRGTAFLSGKTPVFLGRLRAVMDKLRPPEAGEYGEGDVSGEDMAYWRKMLSAIKGACAEYNTNAAKDALTELRRKPWPGAYAKRLDAIAEHLLQSDFEEAAAVCEAGLAEG